MQRFRAVPQLNLYAHERFPEDIVFVQNLIAAYSRADIRCRRGGTPSSPVLVLRPADPYHPFRTAFEARRPQAELAEIRKSNPEMADGRFCRAVADNPAAVQFISEAEAWLCHFETRLRRRVH